MAGTTIPIGTGTRIGRNLVKKGLKLEILRNSQEFRLEFTTKTHNTRGVRKGVWVLCIAISRGSYSENKTGLVKTLVNIPIDDFMPKKYSRFQGDADDIANFTDDVGDNIAYDLIAAINCYPDKKVAVISLQHVNSIFQACDIVMTIQM